MSDWEKRTADVKEIMEKYDNDLGELDDKATRKEFKTVMKWVADSSNRKQRELVGLPND